MFIRPINWNRKRWFFYNEKQPPLKVYTVYNEISRDLFDKHASETTKCAPETTKRAPETTKRAPETTKHAPDGPDASWFTPEVKEAKRSRRRAKHQWRRTGLELH